MNSTPFDLLTQPGPYFEGALPPLEWRNGYPCIPTHLQDKYNICPDGEPNRFAILTKPGSGLVASCIIMPLSGEKPCDLQTAVEYEPANETELFTFVPMVGGTVTTVVAGTIGLVALLVGVALKGSYEYIIHPLTIRAWAYLTRPSQRKPRRLRGIGPKVSCQEKHGSNNVFNGGTHYHVHHY